MGHNTSDLLPLLPSSGDGWAFIPAHVAPVEALNAEAAKIEARMAEMYDTYEGCDWCCGGGDEEMEYLRDQLAEVEDRIAG